MGETQTEVEVVEGIAIPMMELNRRCQCCGEIVPAGEEKCENC